MGHMVQVPFGNAMVTRLCPDLPPQHFATYEMRLPKATHMVPATCEDAGCEAWHSGFVLTVDVSTELGRRQHDYLAADKTRPFHIQRLSEHLIKFVYKPGSECFNVTEAAGVRARHAIPSGRPPVFIARGGDFRGNPTGLRRVHTRAEDWVDDMTETLSGVRDAQQKG